MGYNGSMDYEPQIGDLYLIKSKPGYQERPWELIVMVIGENKQIVLSDKDVKEEVRYPAGAIVRWNLEHYSIYGGSYSIEKLS